MAGLPENLMTVEEVATLLRIAPSTVYSRAVKGDLPAVILWASKRKKVVRFNPASLLEFLQRREVSR